MSILIMTTFCVMISALPSCVGVCWGGRQIHDLYKSRIMLRRGLN